MQSPNPAPISSTVRGTSFCATVRSTPRIFLTIRLPRFRPSVAINSAHLPAGRSAKIAPSCLAITKACGSIRDTPLSPMCHLEMPGSASSLAAPITRQPAAPRQPHARLTRRCLVPMRTYASITQRQNILFFILWRPPAPKTETSESTHLFRTRLSMRTS